jgi:hypothetical protein
MGWECRFDGGNKDLAQNCGRRTTKAAFLTGGGREGGREERERKRGHTKMTLNILDRIMRVHWRLLYLRS